jgi:hypothetical protein
MYSKEAASKLRQQFWTKFGQYMKPVPGAGGEAVNWLNYKTGNRYILFRMDAGKQDAFIAIEIRHPNEEERISCYDHFIALATLLKNETGFEWDWQAEVADHNGQSFSRISQTLENINVLNEKDWPGIIAFLKPRILSLDAFWYLVKDGFQ